MGTVEGSPEVQPRRVTGRDLGVVLWASFLVACGGSVLFFAAVDPLLLREAGPKVFESISREAGYAVGFFFLWGLCAVAAGVCALLLRGVRDP